MPSFWSSKAAGGRGGSPVFPTALTKDPPRAIITNTKMHSTGYIKHLSHDCLVRLIVLTPCGHFWQFPQNRDRAPHQKFNFSHRCKAVLYGEPFTLYFKEVSLLPSTTP